MSTTTLQLRTGVELMRGMDDLPLIYDPLTGTYHRISRSAEALLAYFDGSRSTDELVHLLVNGDASRAEHVRTQVAAFVSSLDSSGLLAGSVPPKATREQRVQRGRLLPRVVVTRSLPRVLEPIAVRLRRLPLRWVAGVLVALSLGGFTTAGVVLFGHEHGHTPYALHDGVLSAVPVFATALVLQLACIAVHELSHALVAQVQRVPVRALGVALLLWFMPVAYVDRTDAYRLRGRGGRVAIAVAGIVTDGLSAGVTALVAASTSGTVEQVALALLGIQLLALVLNINPLLPSDGFTAMEISLGLVDLRGRSFALLRHSLLRRDLPAHLTRLRRRARVGYHAYGLFALAYIVLAVVTFGAGLVHSYQSVAQQLGGPR